MALDLFREVIPSILQTKEYLLTPENEKEFDAYITNRACSLHMDTLLYANEMNQFRFLDKKLQYDYLYYSIPKKKRPYQKWVKLVKSEDINNVMEYYNYSAEKAKEALKILSADDLNYIKRKLDKGGTGK